MSNVFHSVKELNEVGKDLSNRVGDSEPNREKNRYPYILPCKCKLIELKQTAASNCANVSNFDLSAFYFLTTSICIDDHCRVRLSIQNSHPHTDYINANFVPVRVPFILSIIFIIPSTPVGI